MGARQLAQARSVLKQSRAPVFMGQRMLTVDMTAAVAVAHNPLQVVQEVKM